MQLSFRNGKSNQDEVNNFILYAWEFKFHEGGNSHPVLPNADTCALLDEGTRLHSLMGKEASKKCVLYHKYFRNFR